ncbi:alpha-amylase family glycosyl hydrolase [Desulfovibrio gilichinskyi]|uniref:Malto-oligosyltrehalose trehalohydrolase n=1 Tax=Desulfovibrio gilichinskyi TaxID=1519643 RepID=A0A1X7D0L3_9BACT|nr:alpha-amylase family glycosyl hydrolase [Desulfovibrio gilichinskyi]SMF06499.1 maltooligosyl trehalose hydrolase [Desulfovibrio gilichinskyi]
MEKEHFGARFDENGNCMFRLFAPHVQTVGINFNNDPDHIFMMNQTDYGFHELTLKNLTSDTSYSFLLNASKKIPDPASLWQPEGINTYSTVFDHHKFDWEGDNFSGLPINEMIIYEAHVGTFTKEGTLRALISKLDYLSELGINTLELLPVAQFAGHRGWGNKTVFPYAVHNGYGTPDEFKALVKASHDRGIAVILVVEFCQHNIVKSLSSAFDSFFCDIHTTTHGKAINFDEQYSFGVREFYIQCALSWLRDFHIDGLRINNAETIYDQSPIHFLEELSTRIRSFEKENNRKCVLIINDHHNSTRSIQPNDKGGYGFDALWDEDFHHALHYRITGDINGVFRDYRYPEKMVSAMQYGFAYRGEFSDYRKRIHGCNTQEFSGSKLVIYSQNHEQTICTGEECRTIKKAGFEAAKLSAGAVLLSPYTPLLFMGEEYGETAPFNYFSDYSTAPSLNETLDKHYHELKFSQEKQLDPSDESAFTTSQLDWNKKDSEQGRAMLAFYKKMLLLRKEHPALKEPCHNRCQVQEIKPGVILMLRNPSTSDGRYAVVIFNFNKVAITEKLESYLPTGPWTLKLYSGARAFGGYGVPLDKILSTTTPLELAAQSFAVYFHTPLNI